MRIQRPPTLSEPAAPLAGEFINDMSRQDHRAGRSPHRQNLRTAADEVVRLLPVSASRYVTIELFSAMTGLTPGAVRKRIERGVYLEGKQFRRAPDGRIWMDTKGHEQWVARETA
jgi:hypothetical protein